MGAISYYLTEHCCRRCAGRVLRRPTPAGAVYRCADCGFEGEGPAPDTGAAVICWCGALPAGLKTKIVCTRQKPTPESPCEIVAMEAGAL
jgi:hypothetical protein